MSNLGIGQLAKRAGVAIDTVRYYERTDLLSPAGRLASGYRRYGEAELKRLRPGAALHTRGSILGEDLVLTTELTAPEVEAGRWKSGADVQVMVSGATLASLRMRVVLTAELVLPRSEEGRVERVTVLEFTTRPPAFEEVRQAHGLALELARAAAELVADAGFGELAADQAAVAPQQVAAAVADEGVVPGPAVEGGGGTVVVDEEPVVATQTEQRVSAGDSCSTGGSMRTRCCQDRAFERS